MKIVKLSGIALLGLVAAISGCASNLGGDVYSRSEARQVQQVMYGTILELRVVKIEGTKTPIGAIAGAGIGGVAGSAVGGGSGRIITTIIGAVGGGLLGGYGEELLTRSNGVEITIRLDSGSIRSIVQQIQPNEVFRVGERVRLMSAGGTTRVTKSTY